VCWPDEATSLHPEGWCQPARTPYDGRKTREAGQTARPRLALSAPSFRSRAILLALACIALAPPPVRAQSREAFVEATVHFIQAAEGEFGDEGRYLEAALDEMDRSLATWDSALVRVEAELAAEAQASPPPAAARMHTALAAAYLERGRFAAALERLERATSLAPALADAHLLKGLVFERMGRAEPAAAAYRAAFSPGAENLAAAYRVATAPVRSDVDRTAATAAVNDLLAAVTAAGGRRLVFPTDAWLDDASSPAPLLPLARYASAFALLRQAKYDDALTALRAAAASDPLVTAGSPDLAGAAGALRAGDAAGAIERTSDVLDSHPDSGQAHRILGRAYQASGDLTRALEHVRQAVRLDPEDERAGLGLASVLVQAGRIADARLALRETIRRLPASGQAQWRLGELAAQDGDWPAASAAYDAAAALGPLAGAGALHASRARVRAQQADTTAALLAYRDRVNAAPHDSAAHLELGGAARAAGLGDAALVEYLAAALLDPSNVRTLTLCGELLAGLGREAEAATLRQRAIALDPRR